MLGWLKKTILVVLVALSAPWMAGKAGAQGAAPALPFNGWWDARWSGVKSTDSTTNQTALFAAAWKKARDLKRPLFIPQGTYNAGLTLDSTADGMHFILGGDVKIKQTWHLAGMGPDLSISDANYSATTNYVDGFKMTGGRLVLGTGGKFGTFYIKNFTIESPIYGEAASWGVHIYSRTYDGSFGDIRLLGTYDTSSIIGGVGIDGYDVNSIPKHITIDNIHVDSSHYNGVYVQGEDITIGAMRVDSAGLCGLRITGSTTNRVSIGYAYINKAGGNGTNNTTEYLHSGIAVDGGARNVIINGSYIKYSHERAVVINNAHDVLMNTLQCDTNAVNDSGIRYHVLVENGSDNIRFGTVYIRQQATVTDTCQGFTVNGARSVHVDNISVIGDFDQGVLITGGTRHFSAGSITCKGDSIGVQLGGTQRSEYSIQNIFIDSCESYGVMFANIEDSASVYVGNINANGDNALGFMSGIFVKTVKGSLKVDRAKIMNYDVADGRGFQVDALSTGTVHFGTLELLKNTTGLYWDTTLNSGFTFDNVIFGTGSFANTTKFPSGIANNPRTDKQVAVTIFDDTTYFGGYPWKDATPATAGYIPKIQISGTDTSWYLAADAGAAGTGDNVKFDFDSTAVGGSVDITDPIIGEGTGVTFTQDGSTVWVSSAAVVGNLAKVYDGTTYNTPNSAVALRQAGGIKMRYVDGASNDTVAVMVRFNANTMDSSNANGNTVGELTVKANGLDSTHFKQQGISPEDIDSTLETYTVAGMQIDSANIPLSRMSVIRGTTPGSVNNLFFDSVNMFKGTSGAVTDSLIATVYYIRVIVHDSLDTRWKLGGTTYPFAYRMNGSDTVFNLIDSTAWSIMRVDSSQGLMIDAPSASGIMLRGAPGGVTSIFSDLYAKGQLYIQDTTGATFKYKMPKLTADVTDGYALKYVASGDSLGFFEDLTGSAGVDKHIRYITEDAIDYQPDTLQIRTGGSILATYGVVTGIDSVTFYVRPDESTLDTLATNGRLQIKDLGVTSGKMAAASVVGGTGGTVSDNSLTAADIAASAVGNSELGADAVTSDKISNASIVTADVAADGLDGTVIANLQTGDITDQTLTKNDVDTTGSDIPLDDIYQGTTGVGDSLVMTLGFMKRLINTTNFDTTLTGTGESQQTTIAGIKAQTITKTHIDSTSSNVVFDGAYEGTSDVADSQYATKGFIDRGGDELRYISSFFAYGTLVPPTDSIFLSLQIRSANIHFLLSDSTCQGNDTDRVDAEISVPYDFDLDSISLAYITSSATADSSQVDSCEVWGPDRSNGTNAADSNWHIENTAYAGTSLTKVAFAIDESINAGDRFAVRFKNVLKQDASFVRIAWVQFVGKER